MCIVRVCGFDCECVVRGWVGVVVCGIGIASTTKIRKSECGMRPSGKGCLKNVTQGSLHVIMVCSQTIMVRTRPLHKQAKLRPEYIESRWVKGVFHSSYL